ncbi:MAG: DUF4920 domain-containing protein [Candidatus Latescibacterota bacterium]|nr:MAG: DUF4920 domain-containing protein [Candidatus Latescibacterota bacterium]
MTRKGRVTLLVLAVVFLLSAGVATAEKDAKSEPYTLSVLTEKIDKLEKKEVTLAGTIVGVCKSGCKMWIADGEYKKGDPFALVRAKDDAFKFDKDATGKEVILYGYAVAKYMDYCSESGEEQEGAMDKCETPVDAKKTKEKEETKEAAAKEKKKEVTFFATKVEYRDKKTTPND